MSKKCVFVLCLTLGVFIAVDAVAQRARTRNAGEGSPILRADANNDAKVSFEELSQLNPNVTERQFSHLDTDGDGFLTSKDDLPQGRGGPISQWAETLLGSDTNEDGRITFEEAKAAIPELNEERFRNLDIDKNGVLTRRELAPRRSPGGQDDWQGPTFKKILEADRNEDGKVSYFELAKSKPGYPEHNFKRLDLNQDGYISQADIDTFEAMRRGGRDRDGRRHGPQSPEDESRRRQLIRTLIQADGNDDGKVSFEEASAEMPRLTQEMFSRIDRNQDGYITREDRPGGGNEPRRPSRNPRVN